MDESKIFDERTAEPSHSSGIAFSAASRATTALTVKPTNIWFDHHIKNIKNHTLKKEPNFQHLLVNEFHTYACALYLYQFQQITQALILPNSNYPSSSTSTSQISVMLVRDTLLPSSCPSGTPELAQGQNGDEEREREKGAELNS